MVYTKGQNVITKGQNIVTKGWNFITSDETEMRQAETEGARWSKSALAEKTASRDGRTSPTFRDLYASRTAGDTPRRRNEKRAGPHWPPGPEPASSRGTAPLLAQPGGHGAPHSACDPEGQAVHPRRTTQYRWTGLVRQDRRRRPGQPEQRPCRDLGNKPDAFVNPSFSWRDYCTLMCRTHRSWKG